MSTTRHLVNRQRRLATVAATERTATTTTAPRPVEPESEPGEAGEGSLTAAGGPGPDPGAEAEPEGKPEPDKEASRSGQPVRLRLSLPALLCVLTVLLGSFAAWAFTSAGSLRDEPGRQNTALTDISRTSEVKGQITEAVGAVFSYDYASPAKADTAVKTYLVGKAVQQHKDMLAEVRALAPKQKLVLTTTVTESGVQLLDGDRARLLIFADQSNTRTGKSQETTYAAAMFAVDAVRRGGTWRISAIDTFSR
ncbi:hypothetical protein [Streptomyces brevispora]|uniref:Mce-associated membrane protein n=1 Tax=Streptomyces brevispora TaxID=887462 RepID=A0ABZ1G052_9ACTN|nr:hypothetical protein [Streptomyces brevispora]WSC12123.1 hypothetical protein OIE64_04200 [Streptomyces brevispora]